MIRIVSEDGHEFVVDKEIMNKSNYFKSLASSPFLENKNNTFKLFFNARVLEQSLRYLYHAKYDPQAGFQI